MVVSIHAPLAGSDKEAKHANEKPKNVSIHAPLAGSDLILFPCQRLYQVSIHAPLAGSDDSRDQ